MTIDAHWVSLRGTEVYCIGDEDEVLNPIVYGGRLLKRVRQAFDSERRLVFIFGHV